MAQIQPKHVDQACEIAAKWKSLDRWEESYWLATRHHEARLLGEEESRKAQTAEWAGYTAEVPRHKERAEQAFFVAKEARKEVAFRELELEVLRDLLLTLSPELMRLVPVVDFWDGQPADLIQFANWMVEIQSRLLEKFATTFQEESGPPKTPETPKPHWNLDTGELKFNGEIAKTIKNLGAAVNVKKLLNVFQEDDWPVRVDDPLDPGRLRETIKSLNNNLSGIRFVSDGTGEGCRWEPI